MDDKTNYDVAKGLNDLRDCCYKSASERGWHDVVASPVEKLCLWHSEISEALEILREKGYGAIEEVTAYDWVNPVKPKTFGSEVADVIIRIMDSCGSWGIDIEEEVRNKLLYNATRSYRHGGKHL